MDLNKIKIKSGAIQFILSVLIGLLVAASVVAIFSAKKSIAIGIFGLIGLLACLYISGNPRLFCLWGLIISAPLSLGKRFHPIPHMGGAGSYSIELVDLFILALMFFMFRDLKWGRVKSFRISKVSFYWSAMILLGMLSIFLGPFRHIPAQEVFRMVKCLLLYLVVINELMRVKQFMHVLGALTVGVALQGIVGIIQYVFRVDLHLQALGEATQEAINIVSKATYVEGAGTYRISSLLGHPNFLAAFMALILPILIACLFSKIKMSYKVIIAISAAMGGASMVFTLSRAGWVSFAIAFTFLIIMSFYHFKMRRRYLFAKILLIGSVVVMVGAFSGPIIKRVTESHPGAVDFRHEWNEIAWKMVAEKPVLGFGLNTFVYQMIPYSKYKTLDNMSDKLGDVLPVVHNIYLLTWSEQGTLGMLFFIGLHLHVFRLGMRNANFFEERMLFMMNLGCLSGFVAIMADGLVSFFIRYPPCARVYWIVVALITAINYWYRENQMKQPVVLNRNTVTEPPRPKLARV